MTAFTAEQLAQIAAIVGSLPPRTRKAKGGKPGRTKLSDEQKATNAKENETLAEEMFAKAGFKNNKARETIRTYNGWVEVGRRVRAKESAHRTVNKLGMKGAPLFHLDQTDEIVKSN